jgi:small ligand-binding sensory domain FIST
MTDPAIDAMKWANALSTRPSLEAAIAEVVDQAKAILRAEASIGFVFISSAFASEYSRLMPLLQEQLGQIPLIGCSGGGIVGTTSRGKAREVEDEPSLSLTLAYLPNVEVQTFHITGDELPDLDSSPDAWANLVGVTPSDEPCFVILADPFSARINDLLQGLDYAYAGTAKVGGLSSAGMNASSTGLFCNDRYYRDGSVGVALSGDIVMETIVAQGCRPIGLPYWVTEGERNILLELREDDGSGNLVGSGIVATKRTPLEMLRDLVQSLDDTDRELAQQNHIFVGVAQNEFKLSLEPGDFLIRNLIGIDPRIGAIAIGDRIRPGQRIQFHLRDAETSADDLEILLERYYEQGKLTPLGALMFSCLGRGEALYGTPNFDSELFQEYIGEIPVGGFFCSGEIGPVGSSTFLHGYTSVFGIFRSKR